MTTPANESTDILLTRLEEGIDRLEEGQRQILARMDAIYARMDALDARIGSLHAAHRQMMLTIVGLGTTLILAVIGGTITLAIRLG